MKIAAVLLFASIVGLFVIRTHTAKANYETPTAVKREFWPVKNDYQVAIAEHNAEKANPKSDYDLALLCRYQIAMAMQFPSTIEFEERVPIVSRNNARKKETILTFIDFTAKTSAGARMPFYGTCYWMNGPDNAINVEVAGR